MKDINLWDYVQLLKIVYFFIAFSLFCMYVHICVQAGERHGMHVEARGELCELVCLSAMWVMGTRLGRQAWAASVFTHWANP